jgi:hypothetical protein
MESFGSADGSGGQELKEVATSFKEIIGSVKALLDELKLVAEKFKTSGTLRNIKETVRETSDMYKAIKKL